MVRMKVVRKQECNIMRGCRGERDGVLNVDIVVVVVVLNSVDSRAGEQHR
jgi:hypothetical protein